MLNYLFTLFILILPIISSAQFNDNPVIAHRGAWEAAKLPQNSIASLQHAIALNCFGSEFDVHLTKDDVLVVTHDRDFYGIDIATATYQELLAIKHPNGEQIPTAEAYIREGMKQNKTKLIFELKSSSLGVERTIRSAEIALALVKKLQAEDLIEYILFSYEAAKHIVKLDPKAKVSYLNGDVTPQQAKADGLYGLDYQYNVYKNNPTWIKEAKALGLAINVWTVNTRADLIHFLDQHVEYITTDEPELLFQILNERSK